MNKLIEIPDITIASIDGAHSIINKNPGVYRVVSISEPLWKVASSMEKNAKEFLPLYFHDVDVMGDENENYTYPKYEHCKIAFHFLSKGGKCLVHCHAGISRSPGIVLGYLLGIMPAQQAVDMLFALRRYSSPNKRIICLACKMHNKIFRNVHRMIRRKMDEIGKEDYRKDLENYEKQKFGRPQK